MNVTFKSIDDGDTKIIPLHYGTTINEMITKYLMKIGKPELINNKENKISFIYNSRFLRFGDNTKIEQFFCDDKSKIKIPLITVINR